MNFESLEEISYEEIKAVYESKGYAFFDEGDYNLNIFGIRIKTDTNEFDDAIGVAYRFDGNPIVYIYQATTDPGMHYLVNPINPQVGTAILAEGQYRGAYQVAHHQGKYLALCQRKPVTVFRDKDSDQQHDMDPIDKRSGIYGINIHRSNPFGESKYVDRWSAGCQVFKSIDDYNVFMEQVFTAKDKYGNSFTYTLFNIEDFNIDQDED